LIFSAKSCIIGSETKFTGFASSHHGYSGIRKDVAAC